MVPHELHVFAILVEFSLPFIRENPEQFVFIAFTLSRLLLFLVVEGGVILDLLKCPLDIASFKQFTEVLPRL